MGIKALLRMDIGECKTLEKCDEVAQKVYTRFQKSDPNVKGIRWNINLGNDKYALGMFVLFEKSVFIKKIFETEFQDINLYYQWYLKETDEVEQYAKRMSKSNSISSTLGQQSIF